MPGRFSSSTPTGLADGLGPKKLPYANDSRCAPGDLGPPFPRDGRDSAMNRNIVPIRRRSMAIGSRFASQVVPQPPFAAANRGYDLKDITRPRALNRDTVPRKGLSMRGETTRRDLRDGRPGTRPRHPARPPRTQPLVAKRRTHAAKRERPGREARAFTLNLLARQFRARLLK